YVVWSNWSGLEEAFQNPIQVVPLVLACALTLGSLLLTFVRWYVLVRAQQLPFTLLGAVRLGLVGFFFSTFLPGSIGGDIIKAAFIAREQSRRTVAVATVLIDRAVGVWGLCWLVRLLGGVFWAGGWLPAEGTNALKTITLFAGGIVAASLVVWVLLGLLPPWRAERFAGRLTRIPKIGRSAAEFWRAVWMYRVEGKSIWLALLLALVAHVGFVLLFYWSALTLRESPSQIPSVVAHFLIVPIGMIVQALPLTPGGMGFGEFVFGKLYEMIEYPKGYGVLGSLVQRVIYWGWGLIGYVVYLQMRPAL